jgi:hypothetical protein
LRKDPIESLTIESPLPGLKGKSKKGLGINYKTTLE